MADQMLWLRIDDGDWTVMACQRLRIGRAPSCEMVVDHPMVSRLHAEIVRRNGGFMLRAVSEVFLDSRDGPTFEILGGEAFTLGFSPHVLFLRLSAASP